jgi:hypothetical protein
VLVAVVLMLQASPVAWLGQGLGRRHMPPKPMRWRS